MAFFSPMAAFVTGFANQANENLERQKIEDRQNDLIWANKFEKGKAEYEKERKEASEKTKLYNTLKSLSQGNEKAADIGFQLIQGNPKRALEAITWVQENVAAGSGAFQQEPGYQSSSLSDIQANLTNKYQNLNELKGSARQGSLFRSGNTFANRMQMPLAPNSSNQQQQTVPNVRSQIQQPVTQASIPSSDKIVAGSGSLDTDIGNAKPSGPTISLDGGQLDTNPYSPSFGFRKPSNSGTGTQTAQSGNQWIVPYRSPETKRQADQTAIARETLQLEKDKFKFQQQIKPESFTQQQNVLTGNKIADDFFTNPKYGLHAVMSQIEQTQALRYDVNSMAEQLNRGLMAGKGQEVLDEMNRFTSRFLGIDLSNPALGLANQVSDVQLMKKNIANTMIDKLRTLHFGRITNYTESIVKQGLPASNNDPDVNIRIVLALKDTLASALRLAELQNNIAFSVENQEALNKGQKTWHEIMLETSRAKQNYLKEYAKQEEPFPTLGTPQEAAQLELGTWFQNKQDHRMYRFLGVENGIMRIQNAGSKQGGMPETFNIPIGQ